LNPEGKIWKGVGAGGKTPSASWTTSQGVLQKFRFKNGKMKNQEFGKADLLS